MLLELECNDSVYTQGEMGRETQTRPFKYFINTELISSVMIDSGRVAMNNGDVHYLTDEGMSVLATHIAKTSPINVRGVRNAN